MKLPESNNWRYIYYRSTWVNPILRWLQQPTDLRKHKMSITCFFLYWYWARNWCDCSWESITTHTPSIIYYMWSLLKILSILVCVNPQQHFSWSTGCNLFSFFRKQSLNAHLKLTLTVNPVHDGSHSQSSLTQKWLQLGQFYRHWLTSVTNVAEKYS